MNGAPPAFLMEQVRNKLKTVKPGAPLTDAQKLLLPKFRSVNFENALNLHLDMAAKLNDLGFERAKQEALLDSRIKELDAQIAEVYARYEVGKKEIPELTELLK